MSRATSEPIEVDGLDITMKRLVNAPRQLVWDAWTHADQLAMWWGPYGFVNDITKMDVRPGGHYSITQTAPDGSKHPFSGEYKEISSPDRLIYTQIYHGEGMSAGVVVEVTISLTAYGKQDEQTWVSCKSTFQNIAERDDYLGVGMEWGMDQTIDRLGIYLRFSEGRQQKEVTITRMFDAPRELVWQCWTDEKQFAQWWGPHGFDAPVCELDIRPGGSILVHMRGPDGVAMPMHGEIFEVEPPERLVFSTKAFLDDNGNCKLETRNTLTLIEKDGKTEQTMHVKVIKADPELAPALAGMEIGWSQSLDKMFALLANQ